MGRTKRKKGEGSLPATKHRKKESPAQVLNAKDAEKGDNQEEEDSSSRTVANLPFSIAIQEGGGRVEDNRVILCALRIGQQINLLI